MTKVHIQYQDQVGAWKHFTTKHHQGDVYRAAANRTKSTGKRYRLVDDDGALLDIINSWGRENIETIAWIKT